MNGRITFLLSIPLLVIQIAALPIGAYATDLAGAETLWVVVPGVPFDETVADILVRDRSPEMLVLDRLTSAEALRASGETVHGPFAVREAARTFLLRSRRGAPAPTAAAASLRDTPGLHVIWGDGTNFLVEVDAALPDVLPGRLLAKVLSPTPLTSRPASPPVSARATAFNGWVDTIVAQVDSARYFPWISRLAGAEPVMVGGQSMTFTTRSSYTQQCRKAEQYVYEQFQAMGFTDVEYDPFSLGSATPRNVIATLPGTTTPDKIYILCGHLDSTSPQASTLAPGANDNASGTAAVLAAAELLIDYEFDSTIRFIAFTGEEQGLDGSTHYANAVAAAGDDIQGVVNCDMIAYYNNNYEIDIEGRTWAEDLMQVMNDACSAYTGLATTLLYFAWGSDHVPFLQQGWDAFLAIESDYGDYPCYHRTCDTTDKNDAGFGVAVTKACLATVAHIAGIQGPAPNAVAITPDTPGRLAILPNPFTGATELQFSLRTPGPVRLTVHDVTGRLVKTLLAENRPAGQQSLTWDGRSESGTPAGGGIYFMRLEADQRVSTERAIRIR